MAYTCTDYWHGVMESISATLYLSGFLTLIQFLRCFFILYLRYNRKKFDIYFKGAYDNGKGSKIGDVTCYVGLASRKITYKGEMTQKTDEKKFNGEFIMNPINLSVGEGFHYHGDEDKFNFPKLIIRDKITFFIETSYVALKSKIKPLAGFDPHYKGYIWKKK